MNYTCISGKSALMFAVMHGHHKCVKSLTDAGADVNKVTNTGYTAMTYAAESGHINCLKLLFKKGAYVNLLHRRNRNLLEIYLEEFSWGSNVDRPICTLLFAAGERVSHRLG